MQDDELSSFKRNIDLRSYAAAHGYTLSTRESSRGSSVMRHSNGDKIIIKRNSADDHYLWFSVHGNGSGTIIDFAQNTHGLSIGAVRKELRPWLGVPPVGVPSFPFLSKTTKDRMKVEAAYARMQDASTGHPYLETHRAIPAGLLADDRFAGRVRIDDRKNAAFPHFDQEGLAGYELKNVGYTGFASGGSKALYLSNEKSTDNRIVFCESAIDALSHAVLFPDSRTRYASTAGKLNDQQPELIRAAVARMPTQSEIIAAFDADNDGRKLVDVLRQAVELSGRHDLRFTVQEPSGAKDWNDLLRLKPQPFLPYRPEVIPSVT